MQAEYHSVWLMPCPEHERMFASIVQDLAGRFGSPVFQPHLTLVEDMPRSCEELQPLLAQAAEGMRAFDAPIETVEDSALYYRSLYARFLVVPALRTMKEKAVALFGVGRMDTFMPHVSLAYGVPDSAEKAGAIVDLRGRMTGMSARFDRVCIVSSSQKTPIAEWAIKSDLALPE